MEPEARKGFFDALIINFWGEDLLEPEARKGFFEIERQAAASR